MASTRSILEKSLALLLVALGSSCANDNRSFFGNGNPHAKPTKTPLSQTESVRNQTFEEKLGAKYEKTELFCQLWLQVDALDLTQKPNAELRIDLLSANAPAGLKLEAKTSDQKASFLLKGDSLELRESDVVTSENGDVTRLKNSPVLTVEYILSSQLKGDASENQNMGRTEIRESVKSTFDSAATDPENLLRTFRTHAECSIETSAKAGHEDDLIVERR